MQNDHYGLSTLLIPFADLVFFVLFSFFLQGTVTGRERSTGGT